VGVGLGVGIKVGIAFGVGKGVTVNTVIGVGVGADVGVGLGLGVIVEIGATCAINISSCTKDLLESCLINSKIPAATTVRNPIRLSKRMLCCILLF